ncbi:MAG: carbamoyl-phosphate synthase large subunit [Candidatus Latescibacterota bacterium]|nr:MAG: carbamoyl-phosphate synthase large subunit [Candidatus Latescibacterota bacterium]
MPRREDLASVLVLGSGPIVIGQACEFDYSGTQAVKALKREGLRVVLVNSNPATIMTDPESADAVYIEPLTPETVERIIEKERPDALLPTVGGQTGLNLAVALHDRGTLDRFGVELIGADVKCVRLAEDRDLFKRAIDAVGLRTLRSRLVTSVDSGEEALGEIGFPAILRPSFTLGGAGSGVARTREEFLEILGEGLRLSPAGSVLVEESVLGWKEYELEVIRDRAGNGIVVCSIENFDAMGVHTGDSITVAPAQTLTDREFQSLRDDALAVLGAVGVVTGGSNVQFAVNPETRERVVIEMNPRVSRSSALASKATGYPIAKIAALLAVGYTLDELPNEITGTTSACFEPSIDYTVLKVPRWAFEKFPGTPGLLGTTMQSVGEVMAIGRTFREALQKALRSLELGLDGWDSPGSRRTPEDLRAALERPNKDRLQDLHEAMRRGFTPEELHRITGIDPWFLDNLARLIEVEGRLRSYSLDDLPREILLEAKREGFSDRRIARLAGGDEASTGPRAARVKQLREGLGIRPVFRRVDTCAAEFRSETPYLYSTWEEGPCESRPSARRKVIVLGSGPNRIGQGIEFDTCCTHALMALREEGIESILVNCNPETVSTDYDLSDRLYFEPLRFEEVLHIVEKENPEGVIVSLGGQTPLHLARPLLGAGVRILGTPVEAIDRAEERQRFGAFLESLGIPAPAHGSAWGPDEALRVAEEVGYPVMVRPSYVLGGRAMRVLYDAAGLAGFFEEAARAMPGRPVLIDHFLEDAVEFDADAVCDGERVLIGGILQHIEEAGIHSGDSFAVLPPYRVTPIEIDVMREFTTRIALELGVVGPVNVQFASREGIVYVLEVNPRASRTVPFIEKATGTPLTKIATRCMLGKSLKEQGAEEPGPLSRVFVKGPVFPFRRFPKSDHLLGPEMKSTGEVMGIGRTFGEAFAKAELAIGQGLPSEGVVFVSVNDRDKAGLLAIARDLCALGFSLLATRGTADYLDRHGVGALRIAKVGEGSPNVADRIRDGAVRMVINTPLGKGSRFDEVAIRREATRMDIPCITTLSCARAAVGGIRALREGPGPIASLQELHRSP